MDDEDAFLYGDSSEPVEAPAPQPQPITVGSGSGDEVLDFELDEPAYETPPRTDHNLPEVIAPLVGLGLPQEQLQPQQQIEEENQEENDDQDAEEEGDSEEEEDSEDDIEIITEAPTRSIDFRASRPNGPAVQAPRAPPAPIRPVHLTTEYTPKARPTDTVPGNVGLPSSDFSQPSQSTPQPQQSPQSLNQMQLPPQNQADLLPDPVRAPPSHPTIDPSAPGMMVVPGTLQSRPVWEVDLESLSAKSWRRPGANISDWFNYGFDEISWETYCMTRKKLGETASGLKANALEVAGLPEDQFLNLPPEMRSVVLGTAAMLPLPGQGGNPKRMGGVPGMGGPGPGMGPGMGPGGGMGPGAGMGPGGPVQGMGGPGPNMGGPGPNMGGGGPVMGGMGGMGGKMPMGMGPNTGMGMMPNQNMMPMNMMNMPPEVLMQMGQMPGMGGMMNGHGQEEYEEEETLNSDNKTLEKAGDDKGQQFQSQGTPTQTAESLEEPSPTVPTEPAGRGGLRGRAAAARARGFAARGRGRGDFHGAGTVRPSSPLPPNVPTGPRNPNTRSYKDKDRDGDSKLDGLDYGGDRERTQSEDGRRHRDRDRDRERERERERERDRDRDRERDRDHRERDRERDRDRDRDRERDRDRDRERERGKSEVRDKAGSGRKRAHSRESDEGSRSKRR
ncbi:unnamed protein product [Rhizoctonia solani]|uniref:Pre-mRNA polyadenylation factor Fip1 domain-containing protein n=1 Tax=Rhizoctonia solani TaxID=456999 RepID=A0A8H2ZXG8_9AGAM|nr:unnamed protein product [Rhizoctonia solani]